MPFSAARLQHVGVDQDVVARNVCQAGGDVADAAHVGGQVVHLVDLSRGQQGIVPVAQVEQLEFIRCRLFVLGQLDVHAADPVSVGPEALDQMVPDESTGACNQDASLRLHGMMASVLSWGLRTLKNWKRRSGNTICAADSTGAGFPRTDFIQASCNRPLSGPLHAGFAMTDA